MLMHGIHQCAQDLDPKKLQLNITPFLHAKHARELMGGATLQRSAPLTMAALTELWELLVSAQSRPDGIPEKLFNAKMQTLLRENVRAIMALPRVTGAHVLFRPRRAASPRASASRRRASCHQHLVRRRVACTQLNAASAIRTRCEERGTARPVSTSS